MPGVRAEPGPPAASATSSRPPPTAAHAAVSPRGSAGPHGDATRHELTVCRLCVTTTVTFALGLCASAGGSPGLVLTCAAPQLPSWTSPQAKAAGGGGGRASSAPRCPGDAPGARGDRLGAGLSRRPPLHCVTPPPAPRPRDRPHGARLCPSSLRALRSRTVGRGGC